MSFPIQNLALVNSLVGTRTPTLSALTSVPNATAAPAAATIAVPANQTPTTTVMRRFRPAQRLERTVTLTAAGTGQREPAVALEHGNDQRRDLQAPDIRISTPSDGASFTVGQSAIVDYACTDEAGGSGIASCGGPGRRGRPSTRRRPESFSFTVNGADNAGNAASATKSYTVVAPPPVVVAAPPPGRVNVTLSFLFPSGRRFDEVHALAGEGRAVGFDGRGHVQGRRMPDEEGRQEAERGLHEEERVGHG